MCSKGQSPAFVCLVRKERKVTEETAVGMVDRVLLDSEVVTVAQEDQEYLEHLVHQDWTVTLEQMEKSACPVCICRFLQMWGNVSK